MNARVEKNCFVRCFFLVYMALRVENCLSELVDVSGQFKTTCATPENAVVAFGILLRLDQCLKSLSSCSAWIYSIDSPTFHILFNSSSNFRTVSLFVLSLTFYGICDKFTAFFSISSSVLSSKQPLHCFLLLLHSLVLAVGKKMPSL